VPKVTAALRLPAGWYDQLRNALDLLSTVDTDRHTISQQYLHTVMPRYLDAPADSTVPAWTTAHGDLHFANLCAPTVTVLDWEGWGLAPTGYDAAMLHTYSLLVPDTANQVYAAFADILDTPAGLFAQRAVVCELLHSTTRGANLALADVLHHRARQLSTHIRA
jgi:aminoglycoside phosphotransferase (APT) family kinase protein